MKVTFVNHACCKIEIGSLGLLCDPWIDGPVFNFGWDLMIPTGLSFDEILQGVSLIWISHEHPDHFSLPFLTAVARRHRDRVTILFQKTRDRRMTTFSRSLGLHVVELEHRRPTPLDAAVTAVCGAFEFYDSWLYLTDGRHSILNLNDCAIRDPKDLARIGRFAPEPTVLMSQFGYAAWKGGREDVAYRRSAAREKLETLGAQVRALRPRCVFPFASLAYFSSRENSYLNDALNTPRDAARAIEAAGATPLILYPGDAWQSDAAIDNARALARYDECYRAIRALPLAEPGASVGLPELEAGFRQYQERLFRRNARWMMALLARMPLLGAFQPLAIRLYDLDLVLSLSPLRGLAALPSGPESPEVTMHSSSLMFIFANEFGYDTLTVNGRFEANPAGFSKMTRSLAVGSLNAMGLSISPRLLWNFRVVLVLLASLRGVLARMRQQGSEGAQGR